MISSRAINDAHAADAAGGAERDNEPPAGKDASFQLVLLLSWPDVAGQ